MKYVKGDLFTAPYGDVLVHSCNCMARWGAGIAVEFRKRFPEAHQTYQMTCASKGSSLLGTAQLIGCNGHMIANLFVSNGYGWAKDGRASILHHTEKALIHLAHQIRPMRTRVHMPKINAGHFAVPWDQTEALIKLHLEPSTMGVVVYEL